MREEKDLGAVSATEGDAVSCSVHADSASHDAIVRQLREEAGRYLSHLHSPKPLNETFSMIKARIVTLACQLRGSAAALGQSSFTPGNTDGAMSDVVLAAIAYCASKWEWGARLLGNIQAIDIQIAAEKGGNALRENEFMKSCGIVEIAIRNPNVAAYIDHWEFRAERAERSEKDLLVLLRDMEWLGLNDGRGVTRQQCPACSALQSRGTGHNPFCGLAAALSKAKGRS